MDREERSLLLSSGSEDEPAATSAKYGSEPPADSEQQQLQGGGHSAAGAAISEPDDSDDAEPKTKHAWWKRDRKLQKNPSLDKVDEDEPIADLGEPKARRGRFVGVRSYLHNFYEGHVLKDPTIYEDEDEFGYLLGRPRRRRCASIWWKVFVWIGANFLVFGIIGVLVGYLVPQKPIFVGKVADHVYLEDRSALAYNFNLDVCKLVGLILFCIGGMTLAIALLFPSFLYHYCDDERREASIKVNLGGEKPPLSPLEMQIPASSLIAGVQPGRKGKESILTKEGMIPYKD
ncbi:hypothetical protein LSH36_266g00002 [Paralvinella palmiformis]|uniref:Uncharacterized protein n=1 Tax=Paralvinella palmiformis TaxID=53620 RepID=A0AAD9JM07_9ANNE|nr:hypothetical protein LSH36_266g00002 [Paralvinella palmiformis]